MLDNILQILDKITQFGERRTKNREKFVDRYVTPLYSDAEVVYRDYKHLLRDIRKRTEKFKKIAPILEYLEDKRQINHPRRTKMRAQLSKRVDENMLTRFEIGVLGLMTGSLTALDEGHCSFYPLPMGDHTLLDIVSRLDRKGVTDVDADTRIRLLQVVDRQIKGIEYAWSEVVAGYADLLATSIPGSSNRKTKLFKVVKIHANPVEKS